MGALGIRTMSLTVFHWLYFSYFRLEMILEMLHKLENLGQLRQQFPRPSIIHSVNEQLRKDSYRNSSRESARVSEI